MRIAFISPFGYTPKATLSHRILPVASAFKKKGHDVIIVIPPYTNPEASGSIEYHSGIRLVNITLPGKFFYSFRIGFRLANAVRRFEPEKVFIFKPKGYSALAGMFLRLTGKRYPLCLDIDDLESDRTMERRMGYSLREKSFFRFQERWLLRRVEKVTVASRYLMKVYSEKLGTKKVYYLPNGPVEVGGEGNYSRNTEPSHFSTNKLEGKRVVLLYTRFTECLPEDIVNFVRIFSKKYPEGILLVMGDGYGREREEVEAEIEREGLSDFVLFTGWVDRKKLRDYLSLGEVAIYPIADTDFNRAKCSAKLIELMTMGKPVVANPVGEVPAYIKDGESGILAGDTEEMAEKVIGLLEDREKAGAIAKGARDFLSRNFSWDKLISAIDVL